MGGGKARDGSFFEAVLDEGGDAHSIFGVAEEKGVVGYAGGVEGVVCALCLTQWISHFDRICSSGLEIRR